MESGTGNDYEDEDDDEDEGNRNYRDLTYTRHTHF